MEREECLLPTSSPMFHGSFLWTAYYKILVRKDYFFGKHYERVEKRRLATIERLNSQLTEYKNREEQIAKDRTDLTKEREALTRKEESITEREENYEEMNKKLEHYRIQTSQQTEDIVRLKDDNKEKREKVSQLETRISEYYEKKVIIQRHIIRELKKNQLLATIQEIEASIGKKDLVAVVNDKDEVVYASQRLITQLGYSDEEVKGQNYHVFLEKPSDEFLAGREEQGILNLKRATGEPLLVKVSRRLYENPIEINEHEVNIYSGAKVEFEVVSWLGKRRLKKELEEKREAGDEELRERARKLAEKTREMMKNMGIEPEAESPPESEVS